MRALAQENFADENAFQEAKRSEKERNNMKQQLETYERQLQALQLQINDLKTRLQDKEKYNLEELEQELKAYKQIFEQKRELHTKTSQYLEYAENLAKKLNKRMNKWHNMKNT